MKICISEFTYNSFEELLENNFKNDEFILIDSEANIISGEGKPDIALVSYEPVSYTHLTLPTNGTV